MQKTIPIDDYILDTLLRDLTGHDRKPAAFLVYLWLTGEQARRRFPVAISYIELAQNTGLSRSSAQSAVRWLLRRKLLSRNESKCDRSARLHRPVPLAQARAPLIRLRPAERVANARIAAVEPTLEPHLPLLA